MDRATVYLEKDVSQTYRFDRLLRYVWLRTDHRRVLSRGAGWGRITIRAPDHFPELHVGDATPVCSLRETRVG